MGAGSYGNDFDNTGGSFSVDGPLTSEEDYLNYLTDRLREDGGVIAVKAEDGWWNWQKTENGHESLHGGTKEEGGFHTEIAAYKAAAEELDVGIMSYDAFLRDEYDSENERFVETVERAGEALGLNVTPRKGFQAERGRFDDEFVSILNTPNGMIGAGWRSWEHDFVIGVGANESEKGGVKDYVQFGDDYADEIISKTGRTPNDFGILHDQVASNLLTYLRLCLQDEGFDCYYKTGGYTSKKFDLPEDLDAEIERRGNLVKQGLQELAKPAAEVIARLDDEKRIGLIAAMHETYNNPHVDRTSFGMTVPVYDAQEDRIHYFNGFTGMKTHSSPADSLKEYAPDFMSGVDATEAVEGLVPIPRNESTKGFFEVLQNANSNDPDSPHLAASVAEVAAATKAGYSISYDRTADAVSSIMIRALHITLPAEGSEVVRGQARSLWQALEGKNDELSTTMRDALQEVGKVAGNIGPENLSEQAVEKCKAAYRATQRSDLLPDVELIAAEPKQRPRLGAR